jgi:hypothetical protein
MGKTVEEIIGIITNAGRTAEKWDGARKNLDLKKPISDIRKDVARTALFYKETRFDKPRTFKNRFQE